MSLKLSYPLKFREVKERSGLFEIQCLQEKERLSCFKCKDILIEPYQSECGCRFCHSCINNKAKNCPSCNEVWKSSRYDKAIEREIFELNVKCVNKDCENKCKFKELKNHLEVCEYREEKCKDCDNGYLYKDQERHMGITCVSMKVICEDCGMKMSRREMEEKHRNVKGDVNVLCDNMKNVCPYGCSEEVKDSIKVHLINCFKVNKSVVNVDEHTENIENNDYEIYPEINELQKMLNKLQKKFNKLQKENKEIKAKFNKDCKSKEKKIKMFNIKGRKLYKQLLLYENYLFEISQLSFGSDFGNTFVFKEVCKSIEEASFREIGNMINIISFKDSEIISGLEFHFNLLLNRESDQICFVISMKKQSEVNPPPSRKCLQVRVMEDSHDYDEYYFHICLEDNFNITNMDNVGDISMSTQDFYENCVVNDEFTFIIDVFDIAIPESVFLDENNLHNQ